MVIDFHTHVFPEKIAGRTIAYLESVGNIKASTDGTLDGLKKSMGEGNIDISVILPVVTKLAQFETVNNYAAEITGKDGIISFGGIHPETDNYKEELKKIKQLGLKGIKLHPDYQSEYIDDIKNIRIIDYALELGLIIVIHAGIDIGYPEPVHCSPDRSLKMLDAIDAKGSGIVLAHTGGYDCWDDVEEYLVKKDIYFDISYTLGHIRDEQFQRIVRNHGADKILFGTDSPWSSQKKTLEHLNRLDFTDEEKDKILYKNAVKLLNINDIK